MQRLRLILVVCGLMLAMGSFTRADTIFYLTQYECGGSCGAGTAPAPIANSSAVEVIVHLISSTSATVEFIAPSGNIDTPAYINVRDGGTVGNVTATYTEGTVINPTLFSGGAATRSDPGQAEDHFGNMNTWTGAVKDPTVTFTLTTQNGFTWADSTNVLMPTTGYGAAYSQGFEADTAAQYAGYGPSPVPEPASLALFGSGLLGFLGMARRKLFNI